MRRTTLILPLLLAACQPTAPPAGETRIVVCATVYPLADVVRQVGGEHVRVDWILDLGDPLTGFTANQDERNRLTGVDLLLCEGLRTDAWASPIIIAVQDTDKFLSLEQMTITRTTPASGALWLDPAVVREMVAVLADKLGSRMPKHRAEFEQRAAALVDQIDAQLRSHPDGAFGSRPVIVLSTLFDPLLDRFGVVPALVDASPLHFTADDARRITTRAQQDDIRAILVPFDTPAGAVADIETRTGLKVYLLDALGSPQFAGHSDYLQLLSYNLGQLVAATQ